MKVIEVYIRTEERLQPPPGGSYADYNAHPCRMKYNIKRVVAPEDQKALRLLEEAAKQKMLKLKVYDVATFTGRIKAFLKGVRAVPLTILGDRKIEGIADPNEILEIK